MASKFRILFRSGGKLSSLSHTDCILAFRCNQKYISSSSKCLGNIPVKMPALSPTMEAGTIEKWHIKEGESVSAGYLLCEIETDKATVGLEAEEEGILAKILKPAGTRDVRIGTVIAMVVEEGDDWQNVQIDLEQLENKSTSDVKEDTDEPSQTHSPVVVMGYGPAVRSILDIYQLKSTDIKGTGPSGRLLKGDILNYIQKHGLKPQPPVPVPLPKSELPQPTTPVITPKPASQMQDTAPITMPSPKLVLPPTPAAVATADYTDVPLTAMRKTIAKRLTESKTTIPHAYTSIACKMDTLLELRKQLASEGVKVSVNDFITKAVAVALQRVPDVNAIWDGSNARPLSTVDISIAVATPNGLITPIIRDAAGKGLKEISETTKELAGRAREGKLLPHEYQGGSFTISNLGMFGISEFTAIINPPQACILAVGASRLTLTDQGTTETRMTVQMSSDCRVVDDYRAAVFLGIFRDMMERPMLLLTQSSPSVQTPAITTPDTETTTTNKSELLNKLFAR